MTKSPKSLFGFAYSATALDYLETLPPKLRRQIVKKIETLADDPTPANSKLLKGMDSHGEPMYRVRSGDYRALYVVHENPNCVVILDIDHRKDVYR